jgi:hypothetical protein
MLTQDRTGVYVLRNLTIDYKLKKHTQKTFSTTRAEGDGNVPTEGGSSISNMFITDADGRLTANGSVFIGGVFHDKNSNSWKRVWDGIPFAIDREYSSKQEKRMIEMKIWFKSIFRKGRQSPIKYFKSLKESIDELSNIEDKIEYLNRIIETLRESKQLNMLDSAYAQKMILEYEKTLKDNNFKKFITEENLVKFTLKCKKGLRIDYVNEFDRIIPKSVIANRDKAEDLKVFDNYIILHYDPATKNVNLTEKKDPILFGLIKNSNKLYFIDDWIDEKCDLTYDKIIKELNIDEEIC